LGLSSSNFEILLELEHSDVEMPSAIEESSTGSPPFPSFKTITIKELHPTFGAEVQGVNFPDPSEEQFQEILHAMTKLTNMNHSMASAPSATQA